MSRARQPDTAADSLIATISGALIVRFAVLFVGLMATISIPGPAHTPPEHRNNPMVELPNRWDARWYVGIASGGYRYSVTPEERLNRLAFFPAYPLTLGIVARALPVPRSPAAWAWVGLAISLLAFAWASAYLYRLARDIHAGSERLTVTLVAAYPFAIFFGGVYTESFFLLGCTATFWTFSKSKYLQSAAWGFFTGLVRPNGLLLFVPLIIYAINRGNAHQRWAPVLVVVLSPLLGAGVYTAYVWWVSGDALLWASAQETWGRHYLGFTGALRDVASTVMSTGFLGFATTRPYDFLNATAGFVAFAAIIPVGRRLGWHWAAFMTANLLPALIVGGLPSLGRYTAVLFPMHLWAASIVPQKFQSPIVSACAAAQGLVAVLHYTSRPLF